MKRKIRQGIDCVCDYKYICRYHWNKAKWHGTIIAVSFMATLLLGDRYITNFWDYMIGLIGLAMVAFVVWFLIKW